MCERGDTDCALYSRSFEMRNGVYKKNTIYKHKDIFCKTIIMFDTGTIVAISYLFGMLLFILLCCIIFSKITRGTYCCKRQTSTVSYDEFNI